MGIGDASAQTGRCTYIRTYIRYGELKEQLCLNCCRYLCTLRLLLSVKVLLDFSGQRRITSGHIQVRKILQKTHRTANCEPCIHTSALQYSMQYFTLHGGFHLCDVHMHACTCTIAWQATDFSATEKLASRHSFDRHGQGTSVCLPPQCVPHKCTVYTYVHTYMHVWDCVSADQMYVCLCSCDIYFNGSIEIRTYIRTGAGCVCENM